MNKIITKSLVLLALIIASCNESTFLDEENPNALTETNFWKNEGHFNAALAAVYGALQYRSVSGAELVQEFVLGDIAGTESWYRPYPFRNLTYTNGQIHLTNKWEELYVGIFRANTIISQLEEVDEETLDDEAKAQIEGQARFLRAFFYFQVVHTYGGAMIHDGVAESIQELSKSISTMEEVNTQIIIPDLEFAMNNLPESWEANDVGRATWGAAASLLGKTYLYDEQWGQAATLFKEVIDSGIYSLTRNIEDNFWHENEFNEESIFEVNYSFDIKPGNSGFAEDDTTNGGAGAESTTLSTEVGHLQYGAFNTVIASYNLHEMLVYDEVDPNNSINDTNLESRRMNATIAPRNGEGDWYLAPFAEAKASWGGGQSAYLKKHSNWYHLDAEPPRGRSGINFRHIRYADVLLMYAEAVLNDSGDFMTAIEYIDMVRSRAGVYTLQQYMDMNGGMFPQLHVSKQVHGDHPLVVANAQTVLTHIQRVERAIELCFEGHRYKDLVRWGIVKEVFDDLRADEVWREANLDVTGQGEAPLFISGRVRPDFIQSSQNYRSAQHDYFPIPTGEVLNNPNLNN
ncbi:RagB/SusD family nutrient uptake outer membrane protein [Zobellia sp. 1_MG-2023]|uniref:RagB/SusD family nutrient uptake outer membrane protein n=1 Tax=Zobellia sp. 1_MG-2023 TaxID=3062626 RepID=UPI00259525FD|nr:RagB/SusD family nutrient uptake outer membrane protein [Zobellia sp. 1_MG-2023]MDO6820640.1 RagB/SusD family nutrient uptake outer membrane protein [Zobellia sp. 1_MG-2023]